MKDAEVSPQGQQRYSAAVFWMPLTMAVVASLSLFALAGFTAIVALLSLILLAMGGSVALMIKRQQQADKETWQALNQARADMQARAEAFIEPMKLAIPAACPQLVRQLQTSRMDMEKNITELTASFVSMSQRLGTVIDTSGASMGGGSEHSIVGLLDQSHVDLSKATRALMQSVKEEQAMLDKLQHLARETEGLSEMASGVGQIAERPALVRAPGQINQTNHSAGTKLKRTPGLRVPSCCLL